MTPFEVRTAYLFTCPDLVFGWSLQVGFWRELDTLDTLEQGTTPPPRHPLGMLALLYDPDAGSST